MNRLKFWWRGEQKHPKQGFAYYSSDHGLIIVASKRDSGYDLGRLRSRLGESVYANLTIRETNVNGQGVISIGSPSGLVTAAVYNEVVKRAGLMGTKMPAVPRFRSSPPKNAKIYEKNLPVVSGLAKVHTGGTVAPIPERASGFTHNLLSRVTGGRMVPFYWGAFEVLLDRVPGIKAQHMRNWPGWTRYGGLQAFVKWYAENVHNATTLSKEEVNHAVESADRVFISPSYCRRRGLLGDADLPQPIASASPHLIILPHGGKLSGVETKFNSSIFVNAKRKLEPVIELSDAEAKRYVSTMLEGHTNFRAINIRGIPTLITACRACRSGSCHAENWIKRIPFFEQKPKR